MTNSCGWLSMHKHVKHIDSEEKKNSPGILY